MKKKFMAKTTIFLNNNPDLLCFISGHIYTATFDGTKYFFDDEGGEHSHEVSIPYLNMHFKPYFKFGK